MTRLFMIFASATFVGSLLWLSSQVVDNSATGFWLIISLVTFAGFGFALILTFAGIYIFSVPKIVLTFPLILGAVIWALLVAQPKGSWGQDRVVGWSHSLGIESLVLGLAERAELLAFAGGVLIGFILISLIMEDQIVPENPKTQTKKHSSDSSLWPAPLGSEEDTPEELLAPDFQPLAPNRGDAEIPETGMAREEQNLTEKSFEEEVSAILPTETPEDILKNVKEENVSAQSSPPRHFFWPKKPTPSSGRQPTLPPVEEKIGDSINGRTSIINLEPVVGERVSRTFSWPKGKKEGSKSSDNHQHALILKEEDNLYLWRPHKEK